MLKRLFAFFQPPDFGNEQDNLIARALHAVILALVGAALLISATDAASGVYITSLPLLPGTLLLLGALWLVHRRRLQLASFITIFTCIFIAALVLYVGQGIHDIGLMLYPVIIIVAALLLNRKQFFGVVILSILSIGLIIAADQLGYAALNKYVIEPRPQDLLIIAAILVIIALGMRYLSDNLNESLQRAHHNEQQLAEANASIIHQAEQLNSLNRIGYSLSTLRDLKSALRATLEEVRHLVYLDVFFIALCDFSTNRITFPMLLDSGQFYENETGDLTENTLTSNVIRSGQPLLKNYTTAEIDEMQQKDILFGDANKAPASVVMAPLKIGETLLGVIALQSYQPNTYNAEHLALLIGASHQVAIAIENSRLYDALLISQASARHQADQLATLNQIGRSLANLKNLQGALRATLEQIRAILPLDSFVVALNDFIANTVSFPLLYDSGKFFEGETLELTENTLTAQVIRSAKPLLINRTQAEMDQLVNIRVGDTSKPSGSILMAPLQVGEKIIGVVSLQSHQPNTYNEDSLSLLVGASHQIAIAIENARLYDELQKELAERKRAEETVRTLNAELEERVYRRTAELEAANKELESFSYSVSHDLRAPLRAINSYTQIIKADYAASLDQAGHEFLDKVIASGEKMNQLIHELLTFSRVSRKPLTKQPVDLNVMIKAVIDSLNSETANRQIEWVLADLPTVQADLILLQQVIANLVSNAIKYTGPRASARIEIGSFSNNHETIYFVRDNGVGFNMKYADKLFGVFQRLHHEDEFEGTGIGLATVQRIITRHGGRIWAEAELDQGATFYFTLA